MCAAAAWGSSCSSSNNNDRIYSVNKLVNILMVAQYYSNCNRNRCQTALKARYAGVPLYFVYKLQVKLSLVDADTFGQLIDYVYTRSIQITDTNVKQLLIHAQRFLIRGLVERCCEFIKNNMSCNNCMECCCLLVSITCPTLNKPLGSICWRTSSR